MDTISLHKCKGRLDKCTEREIHQEILNTNIPLLLRRSLSNKLLEPGRVFEGSIAICLLYFYTPPWVPVFDDCWMLNMGLSGHLVGPSTAICMFSSYLLQ